MNMREAQKPLDEVMLAMDVVDTLRRNSRVVERELNADDLDQALLERLKDIYGTQGIDVPDHILHEGVQALREDRFTYSPTPPSLSRKLAEIYVKRKVWGKPLLWGIGIIISCVLAYYILVVWPKASSKQKAHIELTQTLPAKLEELYIRIDSLTDNQAIEDRAAQIKSNGLAAIKIEDIALARGDKVRLENLAVTLKQEYQLRIISGRNNTSGVWRVPEDNPNARNYYIIVEPISADGKALSLKMINEESNKSFQASKFGVRVSPDIFKQIMNDKKDDGIIQNNIIGIKRRGVLDTDYQIPVLGGVITKW